MGNSHSRMVLTRMRRHTAITEGAQSKKIPHSHIKNWTRWSAISANHYNIISISSAVSWLRIRKIVIDDITDRKEKYSTVRGREKHGRLSNTGIHSTTLQHHRFCWAKRNHNQTSRQEISFLLNRRQRVAIGFSAHMRRIFCLKRDKTAVSLGRFFGGCR